MCYTMSSSYALNFETQSLQTQPTTLEMTVREDIVGELMVNPVTKIIGELTQGNNTNLSQN